MLTTTLFTEQRAESFNAAPVHTQRAKDGPMRRPGALPYLGLAKGLIDGDHERWEDADDVPESGPAEVSDS